MDTPKYQKSDPAILLLNEIDILLAQTRLMELYLKQAQATAANDNARIHEQYETELTALRSELAAKERQLQQRPAVDVNLGAVVEQLQRELSEKHQRQAGEEAAWQRSGSEITALHQRIAQLEGENQSALSAAREANAIRESLAADVGALARELENNRREFDRQQLTARQLESSLREQLQLLQTQLADRQAYAFNSDDELAKARQEIAALRQHLGSLQALQDELQTNASQSLERAHNRFEGELASLRAALAERDRSVAESQTALVDSQRALRGEIDALRQELEQKQAALRLRDDDMRSAGGQIAALQQRLAEVELAQRQAAAANAASETARRELAEEVANLQHEVEVKEKELVNRYEAVTAVELALHGRIQALQQELSRAHEASASQEAELEEQRAASANLQGRIGELERTQADTNLIDAARRELEGDLNRLRADLAQKEYLLSGHERAIAELEARTGTELATLRQQLEAERGAAARIHSEVDQARAELETSRAQLDAQLKQKDDEILSLRASDQSGQLAQRINDLQLNLAEKQLLADSRGGELEHLRATVSQLNEQLGDYSARQARLDDELNRLTSARDDYARQHTVLEVQLDQARGANATVRAELQETQKRGGELEAQLESQHRAMTELEAERAERQRDLDQLAARHQQSLTDGGHALTILRSSLEAELTAVRGELQQKAWTLAQHQASVENLAQVHREQIRKLEARLHDQQPSTEASAPAVEQALNRANDLQRQVEELQTALGQAQAAGASQAEQIRQEYAARLEAVNNQLAVKSAELANSGAVRANVEESLRAELSRLRGETQSRAEALQSREEELNRVRAEMTGVQNRIVQLQSVTARSESEAREINQAKSGLENELTSLRGEVQQKAAAVAQQQAAMDELATNYRRQVEQLEANLNAQEQAGEQRRREVDQAQTQIDQLHGQIAQLQNALQQAEADANRRADELRREYAGQSVQLEQSAGVNAALEQALRGEIDRLIGEAQERNQILQDRNDELVRVKTDLDGLTERFTQLESQLSIPMKSASIPKQSGT